MASKNDVIKDGGAPTPAPFTLRFTEWRCGHHGQRPDDMQVSSPEQAEKILDAISHAISQPGYARAVLFTDTRAKHVYVSDDDVAVGHTGKPEFGSVDGWPERPTVIFGTAAEVEEIHSPAMAQAADSLCLWPERWDGVCAVEYDQITTTLTQAEVLAKAAPVDWYEEGRRVLFDLPPVFRPAAELLADLREEAASLVVEDAS